MTKVKAQPTRRSLELAIGSYGSSGYEWSTWRDPWPPQLRAARSSLLWTRGYLGSLLYTLQPVPGFRLETLAVDQFSRLYYHDAIFTKWSASELSGVLYHETQHVQKGHAERFVRFLADRLSRGKSSPDPMLWNLACDMEINQWIAQEKSIQLPADAVYPESYNLGDGLTAEEYYVALEQAVGRSGGSEDAGGVVVSLGGENDPQKGEGDGLPQLRPGCGSLSVVPEPESPELEKLAKDAGVGKWRPYDRSRVLDDVASGIEEKKRTLGLGDEEAHQARWAQQRRESAYDWRRELRGELGDLKTQVAGQARANYRRPSRRQSAVGPTVILAGRVNPVPNVAVYGDTSGSMGSEELAEVTRQLPAIVAACGGTVVFAAIDNRIQAVQKITRGSRINLTGGGGTDMTLAVRAAQELVPRPQVVIILTDAMSGWKVERPAGMNVLVGVIADTVAEVRERQTAYSIPEWMRVIPIPVKKERSY